jgi:hypothetical protein
MHPVVYLLDFIYERSVYTTIFHNKNKRDFTVSTFVFILRIIIIIIIIILFILTANGILPGYSDYTIRHNTQITHITQNNTTIKRNTTHKATHTI